MSAFSAGQSLPGNPPVHNTAGRAGGRSGRIVHSPPSGGEGGGELTPQSRNPWAPFTRDQRGPRPKPAGTFYLDADPGTCPGGGWPPDCDFHQSFGGSPTLPSRLARLRAALLPMTVNRNNGLQLNKRPGLHSSCTGPLVRRRARGAVGLLPRYAAASDAYSSEAAGHMIQSPWAPSTWTSGARAQNP